MGISLYKATKQLYSFDRNDYKEYCEKQNKKGISTSLFYNYIKEERYPLYLDIIKNIDKHELLIKLGELGLYFEGAPTHQRFYNLCLKVTEALSTILSSLYKPNPIFALTALENLLGNDNKTIRQYLIEPFINLFSFKLTKQQTFYRSRLSKEAIDSCWHVPFNIREKADSGRFGIPGHPCLYLSESELTSILEIINERNDCDIYMGEFEYKNDDSYLMCYDLRLNEKLLQEANDNKNLFDLLLTYPLRLLCNIAAVHKTKCYCEEYLFTQALMSVLMYPFQERKLDIMECLGVVYDSQKHPGGINYALFAKPTKYPPLEKEKFSNKLKQLFIHNSNKIRLIMKYDEDLIKEKFKEFWKANQNKMHYYHNGKEVFPQKVAFPQIQIEFIHENTQYNYVCTFHGCNIQIENVEKPYKGDFNMKVGYLIPENPNNVPEDKIEYIQDNRINIK